MIKKVTLSIVVLTLSGLLLKSSLDNKELEQCLFQHNEQLTFYKLKAQADSLLNINQFNEAIVLYAHIDSVSDGMQYTQKAKEIWALRQQTDTNYSKLADKLRQRSRILWQLQAKKTELNDSLTNINTMLGSLQHEFDSVLVSNSHINQKVNELNDSIDSIKPKDALTIRTADGVKINYIGEIKDDKANGFGHAIFDTKSYYEGYWCNNLRNGNGRYYWHNGDFYEGEYKADLRNGYGTYSFNSGEQYIGQWENDLRHGHGVLINKDGKVLFKGVWKDNEPLKKTAEDQ